MRQCFDASTYNSLRRAIKIAFEVIARSNTSSHFQVRRSHLASLLSSQSMACVHQVFDLKFQGAAKEGKRERLQEETCVQHPKLEPEYIFYIHSNQETGQRSLNECTWLIVAVITILQSQRQSKAQCRKCN
jgi:hypothetical protein